jgi:hypothetical protein
LIIFLVGFWSNAILIMSYVPDDVTFFGFIHMFSWIPFIYKFSVFFTADWHNTDLNAVKNCVTRFHVSLKYESYPGANNPVRRSSFHQVSYLFH